MTQQLPQDLMHVLLEDIFPLHMEQILEYIVETAGLMTLDEINARIAAFPYAYFNEKPLVLSFKATNQVTIISCLRHCILLLYCSCSDVGAREYFSFYYKFLYIFENSLCMFHAFA